MRKTLSTILSITLLTATLVLSACASAKSQVGADDNTIVSTQAGKIRGSVTQSGVLSFKGVPYAEANERFVPAKPVAKWEGIRDVTEYGKISPQMEFMSTNMVSDEISDNNWQTSSRCGCSKRKSSFVTAGEAVLAKSAEEKARLEKLSETEILAEAKKLYGDKA